MKKIVLLALAVALIAGFTTTAAAYDWRLTCYADSTMDGHAGFLMDSDEPGWTHETYSYSRKMGTFGSMPSGMKSRENVITYLRAA